MRNYILLFFGCLLFHLAGTWSLPLIDRDEPRFAEAAREMRERGDLIVPYFNNRVSRPQSPRRWLPLFCWRGDSNWRMKKLVGGRQ
jgi:4-amino-4-deoxy-L-arabinose transferase-like glycosyltransferase